MKKQFHFRDGSVRVGEIISVNDDIVTLKQAVVALQYLKVSF